MPPRLRVLAPSRRLVSSLLVLPALVIGTLAFSPMAPASALPADGPSVTVTQAGAPASALVAGDLATVTQSAPITTAGQTGQTFESTWDTTQASLGAGGVTTPEGWSLDYTTDGSSWSSTAPADLATVSGVRSSGSVDSNGLTSGLQVSTSLGSGPLAPGASSFNGSGGGDGWDVFFSGEKVLNVYHHNGDYNLDCHLRATGVGCGDVYTNPGYQTSGASSGTTVGALVYSAVVESESSSAGVLCTDTATTPFTSCGFTSLVGESYDWSFIGSQSRSGSRLYVPVASGGGQLACFDTDTAAACPGQPYALPGFSGNWPVPAFSFADSGLVIVTGNQIWCFDAATGDPCSGSWPVGSWSQHSAIPMRAVDGTLTGVCMVLPAGDCFDLSGVSVTMPIELADLLATHPVGEMTGWAQFGFGTTRQYWFTGWDMPPVCWDWATGTACAGFQQTTSIERVRYAIVVDPLDSTCLWSNGDNGVIAPFHAITGEPGCDSLQDPAVLIPYTTAIPRLACAEVGRIRGWQSLTLTPQAGVLTSNLRVTVRDQLDADIPGFIDLTPASDGTIDLSALTVAESSTQPSIKVTAIGASDAQALAITAAVRYTSDPPQLCVDLTMDQECPTVLATYPTPGVPVSDLALDGAATADASGDPTVTPLPASATRAAMLGCLGDVGGTVTRSAGGPSTPVVGVTVQLLAPDDSVVDSTTTDPSGDYSFANAVPAGYTVRAVSTDGPATITAGGSATADLVVPVAAPDANPVHADTLQNSAATFSIDASADPAATIDLSTLVLSDGGGWVTTLPVTDEGTWEVVTGTLRFTPLIGFTGRTSDVTYRITDDYDSTASSTAYVNVSEVLPTAAAIAAAGLRGATLTVTPAGASASVPLDPAGTRLINPATSAAVSTLVVPGVGTYTVDGVTGLIQFVPEGTFVGAHTAVYQVRDTTDRVATAVSTVTVTAITITQGTGGTIKDGQSATVPLNGIPTGATVTVPADTDHASSVSVTGGVVSVTPDAGFSGIITVPVTIQNGTATVVYNLVVQVHPRPASLGRSTLAPQGSIVRWSASPTASVTKYRVYVGGRLVCTTTATKCIYGGLIGPRTGVVIRAIGGSGLVSAVSRAPYVFTRCSAARDVHFTSGSTRLSPTAKAVIKRTVATMRAKGFRHLCLVGHTDNVGSLAYNKALSRKRVQSVRANVATRFHPSSTKVTYRGETAPLSGNGTPDGRRTNRRVTISFG